jgi:hypothetical protein
MQKPARSKGVFLRPYFVRASANFVDFRVFKQLLREESQSSQRDFCFSRRSRRNLSVSAVKNYNREIELKYESNLINKTLKLL